MVHEKNDKIAEYRKRKPRLTQKRVQTKDAEALTAGGDWTEKRRLPNGKVILEKQKSDTEILQNRLWCTLYQFGFTYLNKGNDFQIPLTLAGGTLVQQRIAVLARMDDVIIIAVCKSAAKRQPKSLHSDINELVLIQRPIANAIRKIFDDKPKFKIIWVFLTGNVVWSHADRTKAKAENIHVIEERELRYFEQIAKNIGPAAKFQFLGEFLNEQRIPALSNYQVTAIRTKLGGNVAYYFLAPSERVLPIAFVNHRGLRDPEGAPAYQRLLNRTRLREIGNYLDNGGYFPNSIIMNFKDSVRFDIQASSEDKQITFGQLYLPNRLKSAWIIDGQHRLFGFTESKKKGAQKIVPCLAFEKLSANAEADLFATINGKQQKVARGLLDELAGELKLNSDDFNERANAIAARALDMMAGETGNPFEDRIKTADLEDSDTVCLTISAIKHAIIAARIIGAAVKSKPILGPFSRWNTRETLDALCDGLTKFFMLVESANQERWEAGRSGYLCSNIAIQGYIRLLGALIEYMEKVTGQNAQELDADQVIEQISVYLQPVLEFVEITEDAEFKSRFKPTFGSGGPPRYFFQLCVLVRTKFPDFKPDGFDTFLGLQESETTDRADALAKDIITRTHNHVISVLKINYGEEYFERGVPQKEIKLEAIRRRYDDKIPMAPETYLDVIDLKRIVEHAQNWEMFKGSLSIQMPEEKKGQAKYLKWLETLNEVRRIPAHPYGRTYKESDVDFLEFINEQLDARNI